MKKIIIIDGFNILYRMFFAVPPFSLSDGTPINAVYGVAKLLSTIALADRPDALFFVLDGPGKKSRAEYFADYKATRDRMPDQLRAQESFLYELLKALGLPPFVFPGTEADDVIGTLVTKLRENSENDIYIYSGDKDLYQFVGERVAVVDTMKKVVARRAETIEKFGVEPSQVVDYLAIVGDASDNIPGINGFGPKKAVTLLAKYGTLQSIYDHLDELPEKMKETLL
jgi:DNA polymerase-1